MPRFEREIAGRRDVWEASLDELVLTVREGKIGGRIVARELTFNTPAMAEEQMAFMVAERLRDGWERVDEDAGRRSIVNPEMAAALGREPDSVELAMVYADWLIERDHPLGRLIQLQGGEGTSEHLAAHRAEIYGPLLPALNARVLRVDWRRGVFQKAVIAMGGSRQFAAGELARQLLAHPAACALRTLGVEHVGEGRDFDPVLAELAAVERPALIDLTVGAMSRAVRMDEASGSAAELGRALACAPNLRRLGVSAGTVVLGALALPALRELDLHSWGNAGEAAAVAEADWPSLERLRLDLAAPLDAEALGPLLEGRRVPKLTTLGLMGNPGIDALLPALADAPLLAQLRELDLSGARTPHWRGLSDAGARVLIERRESFAHLKPLQLGYNRIHPALAARLVECLPHAKGARHRAPTQAPYAVTQNNWDHDEDDDYYDEVME